MSFEGDNVLIVEFRQGSQQGFKQIYNLYKFQLYQFVHNLILNRPEAEDITADCFIKIWNKRTDFESIIKIKSFLFISAHNACINYLKHIQVQNKSEKELAILLEKNEDFILAKMIKAEALSQIYAEIENLPPQCKKIFKMLYLQGLDYGKIAKELNLDESTVRHQKRRAIKLLRNVIFQDKALISILVFLSGLRP